MPTAIKGTYAFVSLGCAKALVDSETMLGKLAAGGYVLQPSPEGADVVVVNTCGFIEPARQESLGVIREMLDLKRQGKVKAVIVAGCLAERKKEALLEEMPEVDHLVGVFGRDDIARVVDQVRQRDHGTQRQGAQETNGHVSLSPGLPISLSPRVKTAAAVNEQRTLFRPAPVKALNDQARLRITPRHFAYLKISEGCDRLCTFCAIPGMRGKHVTKPIEQVAAEARELASDGVRELILVAQDTTYYGRDLYGEVRLTELLRELDRVDGFDWIRILYVYPMYLTDELLATIAGAKRIIPYLDMPLQHINDVMLRRMARQVTRSETEALLTRLRSAIPNLVMRTTFIVGFPGETDAQFRELCEFARAARFERAGVFTYSLEPDTPAERMKGHLPEAEKTERRNRLMEVQQEVAFTWSQDQVGRELDVLIDRPDAEVPGWFLGRSYADAPDIDGVVRIKGKNLCAGDLVRTKISAADGYDLVGRTLKHKS
jgi:ribosomal protein S12 methylthiotransferase